MADRNIPKTIFFYRQAPAAFVFSAKKAVLPPIISSERKNSKLFLSGQARIKVKTNIITYSVDRVNFVSYVLIEIIIIFFATLMKFRTN